MKIPLQKKPALASLFAFLLITVFSSLYVFMTFQNYRYFETGLDLGGYVQALYRLSNFQLPFNTFKGQVMWGDHAHFIIALLAPVYRFFPDARVLLLTQALAVTTAGWALFKISQSVIKSSFFSLAVLYSYLAFIGTQYALNFDFHPSTLTGAAILWFFYGLHFEKKWIWLLSLVLGLTTREDAPPIFFMIGFYLLLRRQWKVGLFVMFLSAIYFTVVAYFVMPLWTDKGAVLSYLDTDKKDPIGVAKEIFKHPKTIIQNTFDTSEKVKTITTLFSSFGYLPLFAPLTYLSGFPIFFSRFNSPNEYRWLINNHSNANIVPILALGALYGAAVFYKIVNMFKIPLLRPLLSFTLSILLIVSVQTNAWNDKKAPLKFKERHEMPEDLISEHELAISKVKELIPAEDMISVSSGFTSRLANRDKIQNYPDMTSETKWLILSPFVNTWPYSNGVMRHDVQVMREDKNFELAWYHKGTYFFRRVK